MFRASRKAVVVGAVVAVAAAACSSSSSGGNKASGGSTPGGTQSTGTTSTGSLKIGILADLTGPGAAAFKTTPDGVKAGILAAKKLGFNISFVEGDTQTSPTAALTAAQKLVQQDHVQAIVMTSSLGFLVSSYLTKADIPVVGAAIDGPEWISSQNMFSVFGPIHTDKVDNTTGLFLKSQGVTKLGTLGYSISPTSSQAAKGAAVSAEAAGLQAPYVNTTFQFGSTDVQPVALAMKNKGVDAIIPTTDSQTSFALVTALRNLGVPPKVALFAEGYGSDLLDAGAAAEKAAQGTYYELQQEPVEMNTPATKTFVSLLQQAGGGTHPNLGAYEGYMSMLLLAQGLQGAPANPSSGELVASLAKISSFTADGLYGGKTVDVNDRVGVTGGPAHCLWMVKFSGSTFHLVPGADPICGATVPGKTVS